MRRAVRILAGLVLALGAPPLAAFAFVSGVGAREVAPAPAPRPAPAAAPARPAPAPAKPAEGFTIKGILDIPGPIRFGEHFWDETGAPADGTVVITVDLEAQTLSVFRGGHEIGAAAILYGADDKPTPLGTFPISEKDADHVSNLYDAPMPYMLRLTNDGITIHGSTVEAGYATHGCIGVPVAFARKLFGVAKLGDKVIVTRGKRVGVGDRII